MTGFKVKAVVALGATTAALAASSSMALAADDPGSDPAAALDAAAQTYRSVFPQMSEAASRAVAAQEDERKQLITELTRDASDTFGGAWFDPPSGVLHVAGTTAATASRAEDLGRSLDLDVQTHLVQRSFTELQRQADALRDGGQALGRAARQQVGIDVQANRVVAAVPAQRLSALRRLAAPSGTSVIRDPNLRTEADAGCTSRDACDWTIRSGAVLWRAPGQTDWCSVGFTARNASNQRFAYTAGHCSTGNGVNWGTGSLSIGTMQASVDAGVLDAAIIRVTNPWFTGDLGGEIYHDAVAGKSIPLNGVAPSVSYMLQGERVCLAAHFTQHNGPNQCGVIGAVSDARVRGMTRVDGLDGCGGDSGGGWYWLTSTNRRIAYGLHSRSDAGCRGDQGGSRSWYSPIASVNAWSGLTVETRP